MISVLYLKAPNAFVAALILSYRFPDASFKCISEKTDIDEIQTLKGEDIYLVDCAHLFGVSYVAQANFTNVHVYHNEHNGVSFVAEIFTKFYPDTSSESVVRQLVKASHESMQRDNVAAQSLLRGLAYYTNSFRDVHAGKGALMQLEFATLVYMTFAGCQHQTKSTRNVFYENALMWATFV